MKSLSAVLFSLLILCGCKPGCVVQDTVSTAVSGGIIVGLQCKNGPAVKASVDAAVGKVGLCPTAQLRGPACSALLTALVSSFGPKALPSEWECNPDIAVGALTAIVNAACSAIPF